MRELERKLDLKVPVIDIVKIQTPVSVPQKSLGKLEDRIENARVTIFVEDPGCLTISCLLMMP